MEEVPVVQQSPAPANEASEVKDSGPLPMSFPAILRNPGLSDRFAHLRMQTKSAPAPSIASVKRNKRDDKEGKRWVRRKENGTLCKPLGRPAHEPSVP